MMIRGKIVCWNILWKEKNKSNSLRIENNANIGNSVLNICQKQKALFMTRTHHSSDTQNYCNEFVQIFLTQMYFILFHSTKNSQLKMRPMRWAFELSIETLNLTILYLWCNREILTITNICWYNTIFVFLNIEL